MIDNDEKDFDFGGDKMQDDMIATTDRASKEMAALVSANASIWSEAGDHNSCG